MPSQDLKKSRGNARELRDLVLGHGADVMTGDIPCLEQEERRNREDGILVRELRMVFYAHTNNFQSFFFRFRKLFEDGFHHMTRAAPRGPELDEDRLVGLENLGIKGFRRHVGHDARIHEGTMMRILAADTGGTHARTALLTKANGTIEFTGTVRDDPTPQALEELLRWIAPLSKDADGIALAIAGVVLDNQRVRSSANISFIKQNVLDLGAEIHRATGKLCVLFNDMEAALAGELVSGALKGCRWAFMDTVSTGWGGALLLNGEIVAAEPGHTPSGLFEGRRCGLGHKDCNEAHFSGGQVEERVRLILKQKKITIPKGTHPNALADAAVTHGERWAVELYRYVAEGIGKAWAYRMNLIPRIEKIVYTGGFLAPAMELPLFRDTLRQTIQTWTSFPELHRDLPIEQARAEHGALRGAAYLYTRLQR